MLREDLDYLIQIKNKQKAEARYEKQKEFEQDLIGMNGLKNVDKLIKNDKRNHYIEFMKDNIEKLKNKNVKRFD